MISYSEALQIINDELSNIQLQVEEVRLEAALNRTLAEDIISDIDIPPFDNSAMDGYALKFSDRRVWNLIGEVKAGNFKEVHLTESDAVLITTGSKILSDADTVVPIEDVLLNGNQIRLNEGIKIQKGLNIRFRGNNLTKGSIALNKFTKIDSKSAAVLASCGRAKIKVFSKLKIGILATGDELISIDDMPEDDKIRISNSYALSFAVSELNHVPINYGFVKDEAEAIRKQLETMISDGNDIIITTGSASVGKYDFIKEIFRDIGIEIKFWKVNVKPGKPIVFGVFTKGDNKKLIFGLPGNPVSCLVNFHIFIKPAIQNLFKNAALEFVYAELANDIKKKDEKRHFIRGILSCEDQNFFVRSEFSQSSGNLVEISKANCLIEIPEEKINPKQGEIYKCIKI